MMHPKTGKVTAAELQYTCEKGLGIEVQLTGKYHDSRDPYS